MSRRPRPAPCRDRIDRQHPERSALAVDLHVDASDRVLSVLRRDEQRALAHVREHLARARAVAEHEEALDLVRRD